MYEYHYGRAMNIIMGGGGGNGGLVLASISDHQLKMIFSRAVRTNVVDLFIFHLHCLGK